MARIPAPLAVTSDDRGRNLLAGIGNAPISPFAAAVEGIETGQRIISNDIRIARQREMLEAQERENSDEFVAREVALAEANIRIKEGQAEGIEFENSPEQQQIRTNRVQTQIDEGRERIRASELLNSEEQLQFDNRLKTSKLSIQQAQLGLAKQRQALSVAKFQLELDKLRTEGYASEDQLEQLRIADKQIAIKDKHIKSIEDQMQASGLEQDFTGQWTAGDGEKLNPQQQALVESRNKVLNERSALHDNVSASINSVKKQAADSETQQLVDNLQNQFRGEAAGANIAQGQATISHARGTNPSQHAIGIQQLAAVGQSDAVPPARREEANTRAAQSYGNPDEFLSTVPDSEKPTTRAAMTSTAFDAGLLEKVPTENREPIAAGLANLPQDMTGAEVARDSNDANKLIDDVIAVSATGVQSGKGSRLSNAIAKNPNVIGVAQLTSNFSVPFHIKNTMPRAVSTDSESVDTTQQAPQIVGGKTAYITEDGKPTGTVIGEFEYTETQDLLGQNSSDFVTKIKDRHNANLAERTKNAQIIAEKELQNLRSNSTPASKKSLAKIEARDFVVDTLRIDASPQVVDGVSSLVTQVRDKLELTENSYNRVRKQFTNDYITTLSDRDRAAYQENIPGVREEVDNRAKQELDYVLLKDRVADTYEKSSAVYNQERQLANDPIGLAILRDSFKDEELVPKEEVAALNNALFLEAARLNGINVVGGNVFALPETEQINLHKLYKRSEEIIDRKVLPQFISIPIKSEDKTPKVPFNGSSGGQSTAGLISLEQQ